MPGPHNIIDTIVAISTPPGVGGIGIVRLSGPDALAVTARIFKGKGRTSPDQWGSHTVHYGYIVDGRGGGAVREEAFIDEVLVTVMRAPRSYTAEDVVEISCHGGAAPLKAVLNLAMACGARLAEPGEFTKRAFLNGRMDLTQAEAVLDIIRATSESFLKVGMNQLKGDLTKELERIREKLMKVYAELEAGLNFPEEEIAAGNRGEISSWMREAAGRIKDLLRSGEQGRLLKEGIRIVICGKPNVGKSSLLNVLLQEPRAIVSSIPGTTRDTIEEMVQIDGIPFSLVDTAGILEPRDVVEQEAVERSRLSIRGADLILFVLDADRPVSDEDRVLKGIVQDQPTLVVVNKCDLNEHADEGAIRSLFPREDIVYISALHRTGIDRLKESMAASVWGGRPVEPAGILVSHMRHIEALRDCAQFLEEARRSFDAPLSGEFVSEDIKRAVRALDTITGRQADEDLLDRIFSSFCIGK